MTSLCLIGWLFLKLCPRLSLDLCTIAHPLCVHLQMLQGTPGLPASVTSPVVLCSAGATDVWLIFVWLLSSTELALVQNPTRPYTDPMTGAATKRRAGLTIPLPVLLRLALQTSCSHDSVVPRVNASVHLSSLVSSIAGAPSYNHLLLARVSQFCEERAIK